MLESRASAADRAADATRVSRDEDAVQIEDASLIPGIVRVDPVMGFRIWSCTSPWVTPRMNQL